MLLNPLLQLFIYTIVFSTIMRMGIDKFYLFLFVALVPWLFFSTCLTGGTGVIFSQQDMVKKIYFPREVLPISYTVSQFVNMLLSFIVIFVVIYISGVSIHFNALIYLPIVMIIEFILALGITYIASCLNVYFRDLEHILGILSMAWMYLTPILYPVELVPEQYMNIIYLNPMTSIIIAYRDILYYGKPPSTSDLWMAGIAGVCVLIAGQVLFGILQRHFVEEL